MEDLEKLKKILNEPITVNNLNRINDYFVRYLFSHTGVIYFHILEMNI